MGGIHLALAFLAGVGITWQPFKSHTYPYTISQPSSYKHVVLEDSANHQVDYFFPTLLGSSDTNVNVYCDHTANNLVSTLRSIGGRDVHRVAWVRVMGHRHALIRASFVGIPGRWTIEQTVVRAKGHVWHLTISYANEYHSQRKVMLRMLQSFRLR